MIKNKGQVVRYFKQYAIIYLENNKDFFFSYEITFSIFLFTDAFIIHKVRGDAARTN